MVIHMQQKKENDNIMNYDTVRLDDENNAIIIIDQTKLPGSIELIALKTAEEIWDAIYLLRVRGAPAIGVAAAFGIYLLAKQSSASDSKNFCPFSVACGCKTADPEWKIKKIYLFFYGTCAHHWCHAAFFFFLGG